MDDSSTKYRKIITLTTFRRLPVFRIFRKLNKSFIFFQLLNRKKLLNSAKNIINVALSLFFLGLCSDFPYLPFFFNFSSSPFLALADGTPLAVPVPTSGAAYQSNRYPSVWWGEEEGVASFFKNLRYLLGRHFIPRKQQVANRYAMKSDSKTATSESRKVSRLDAARRTLHSFSFVTRSASPSWRRNGEPASTTASTP
jgi:hypothetical protein